MSECPVGAKPKDDDGYFEEMTKAVFRAGFNWAVIEKKWPGFRKAFAGFSVGRVARFDDHDVERLMKDPGIVRNERKILATIKNARTFEEVAHEERTFSDFIRAQAKDGEDKMAKTIIKRFSNIGPSSILFFLRSVGEEMPEMTEKWVRQHHV